MTAERWQRVEAILQSALDLEPGEERIRFVSDACAGDEEVRREVERLIAADAAAESFIESPAWTASGLLDPAARKQIRDSLDSPVENGGRALAAASEFVGRKVGVYELQRELGRGGMGTVYLAERADGEFRQQVAVKLINRGMDTDFIVKRFRHERQILAALEHPFIARLLTGGTSAEGLPYFVMEYVEGERLYPFCDRRRLDVNGRLRLYLKICSAVGAAHRIRVVHRDLKPSNILVRADGTPKLLDFGIAKILDAELASATLEPTATAVRLMTPEYASPEQVCGEPVSPASDIYSLGVLLYELLTGHRPYRFKNRALHEIHRAVCEEQPSVPSESLTQEDNLVPTVDAAGEKATGRATSLAVIFRSRNTDFDNLRRELSGDLDKIVLKTLRKNPAERYQSAAELAADINAYLERRPVKAESFAPEIKPAQSPAVATARVTGEVKTSIAILPFKMFGAGLTIGTKDTDSQEFLGVGLADALITRLSVIRQIVVRPTSSVLAFAETVDPLRAGQELAVDFVVDGNVRRAGGRIRVTVQLLSVAEHSTVWAQTFDQQLTDVLALEDSISEKVADSLLPQLTGEEQAQLHKRGTDSPAAYEAYLRGRFYWNQFTPESLAKAIASLQTAIRLDENYALAYVGVADFFNWANIYGLVPSLAAHDEAERAARRAIEIDPQLGEAYASLGLAVQNRFRWAEAEKIKLHGIALSPNYSVAHESWAAQLIGTGRTEEGARAMRLADSLDPLSLRTKTLTAWMLLQAHRFDEALAVAGQILELDRNYPQGYAQTGMALWALKRYPEALPNFQRFDEMLPGFALAKYQLCFGLAAAGRAEEARAVLDDIRALAARSYVKPYFLALAHVAAGDRDAAFEYFEQSFAEQEPWLIWFGTDPMLECLHDDPRFLSLLERMKNPIVERFTGRRQTTD
jgi:serine/threonine protein kinase/Tfp pilus assembly protein PilF